MTKTAICAHCSHMRRGDWAHELWACDATSKYLSFVTGDKARPLCKDINPDGLCGLFQDANPKEKP